MTISSRMGIVLGAALFIFLVVTAIAGFTPSYILLVLVAAYIVMFQLGSRIRKR